MSNRTVGGGPGRRMSIGQILLVVAVIAVLWFRSGQVTVEDPMVPPSATVQLPGEALDDLAPEAQSSGFEAGELEAITEPEAGDTGETDSGDWSAGSVSSQEEAGTRGAAAANSTQGDEWSSGEVTGSQGASQGVAQGVSGLPTILYADLPDEAKDTIALIDRGGPYPFRQDGGTFQNREGILPDRSRGYYQEFTVISPWEDDRGARRIVSGADGELYYTDDHYDSFREVLR